VRALDIRKMENMAFLRDRGTYSVVSNYHFHNLGFLILSPVYHNAHLSNLPHPAFLLPL
jgi:hypothetical protein